MMPSHVATILSSLDDEYRSCSHRYIAETTPCSTASAARGLADLVALGIIERRCFGQGHAAGVRYEYRRIPDAGTDDEVHEVYRRMRAGEIARCSSCRMPAVDRRTWRARGAMCGRCQTAYRYCPWWPDVRREARREVRRRRRPLDLGAVRIICAHYSAQMLTTLVDVRGGSVIAGAARRLVDDGLALPSVGEYDDIYAARARRDLRHRKELDGSR